MNIKATNSTAVSKVTADIKIKYQIMDRLLNMKICGIFMIQQKVGDLAVGKREGYFFQHV